MDSKILTKLEDSGGGGVKSEQRSGYPQEWNGQPLSDDLIRREIPRFKWFVGVNFGNGIVARPASWPDAPQRWPHMGVGKFEYIVQGNLPDLQGKRILDLGCNTGMIAIHMARLGAAEVIGIDRQPVETARRVSGSMIGWQGWREQAEFVKTALEWRCKTTYNVRFLESDMRRLPELELGRFDAVTALNSIYYLEEEEIRGVVRYLASITDYLVVQCNTKDHRKTLGRRAGPGFIREVLTESGFPVVRTDEPWDRPWKKIWPQKYFRPVVVGTKGS